MTNFDDSGLFFC